MGSDLLLDPVFLDQGEPEFIPMNCSVSGWSRMFKKVSVCLFVFNFYFFSFIKI